MAERTLRVALEMAIGQYKNASRDAAKATGKITDALGRVQKVGAGISRIGDDLTRRVSLPLVALGAVAFKMASDFDSAFTRMQTLAGVSASEVDGLKQSVLNLSGETGKAPLELAEALYFLQSSGLSGAAAMDALEMSAKASAAGLGSTVDIANAVSSAMNAYAQSGLSAAEATDVLVQTARLGKAEPAELAAQMGRVLPIAAELDITFQDVGAALASLSLSGNDAAMSTTQLTNLLSKILRPSERAQEMLEGVGLSLEDLQEMVSGGNLLGALEELRERLGDNGFARFLEDQQAVLAGLSLTGENVDRNRQIFDEMADSTGALDNAFGTWAESMGAENAQAFAKFQVAMISAGEKIAPFASNILEFAGDMATAFDRLPDGAQKAVLAFAGIAAALGPVLSIGGRYIEMVAKMARLHPVLGGLSASMLPLTAIGIGLGLMWMENARAAAAAEERVRSLTDAIKQQEEGARGAVEEQIALQLATGDMGEALRDADANMVLFADAVKSGGEEIGRLREFAEGGFDQTVTALEHMADGGSALADELLRLAESGELTEGEFLSLVTRLDDLTGNFDDASQAAENEEFAQESLAEATGQTTAEIEAQTQALQELAEQLAAQFDPLFGLISAENANRDALQAEAEAVAALDEARRAHGDTSAEAVAAEQALRDAQIASTESAYGLEAAQLALLQAVQAGDVSFDDALSTLAQWRSDGTITASTADYMRARVLALKGGLEDTAGRYGVDVSTRGVESSIAGVKRLGQELFGLRDRTVYVQTVYTSRDLRGGAVRRSQHGGRLEAGEVSIVGEGGPELWVADRPGRIIPNYQMAQYMTASPGGSHAAAGWGGGTTVIEPHFHFHGPVASQPDAERWVATAWNRAAERNLVNVRGRRP